MARTSEVAEEERPLLASLESLVTSASRCRGFHVGVSAWALGVFKTGGLGNRKMVCLIALVLGWRPLSRDFVSWNLLLRTSLPEEVLIYCQLGSWAALAGGRRLPQASWWIISFWERIPSPTPPPRLTIFGFTARLLDIFLLIHLCLMSSLKKKSGKWGQACL